LANRTYQLGNGSTIDFTGIGDVHRGGILISALITIEATHQEIIQIGIALKFLVRLLDRIIGNDVILFYFEVGQVECSITDRISWGSPILGFNELTLDHAQTRTEA
jgi:hypothetical protein